MLVAERGIRFIKLVAVCIFIFVQCNILVKKVSKPEKAVEQLHIGLDDFACDGVGISDYDKAVNLRIASELICSEEFSQMIYRLRLMEEASYDEGILRILEAEYSEDALTDTDEFVFATPEDRAVTIKAIEHMLSVHGESNALTEKVEDLGKMSDDELSVIVISELISRRDSNL